MMVILSKEALLNQETLREFQHFKSSRVCLNIGVKLCWRRFEVGILIPRYVIVSLAQVKGIFFFRHREIMCKGNYIFSALDLEWFIFKLESIWKCSKSLSRFGRETWGLLRKSKKVISEGC